MLHTQNTIKLEYNIYKSDFHIDEIKMSECYLGFIRFIKYLLYTN